MIAVAVLALVLGGEATRRRWDYYRHIASYHADAEHFQRFLLGGGVAVVGQDNGTVVTLMGPTAKVVAMADGHTGYIQSIPQEPTL